MGYKISTIIVEDEPLAREGLISNINEIRFLELVAVCEDALEANNAILEHKPHLMFLDIKMPQISGIEFLSSLSNPPMVVFTTAYPKYALQGYDLNIVDYLVKPYPFNRFLKAINKVKELYDYRNDTKGKNSKYFFAKVENKLERITFEEILYIEGMENYVSIYITTGRCITLMTMKAMEELLPTNMFLRIHNSYIVNVNKIQVIQGNELIVEKKNLPISRKKKAEIVEKLVGRNWKNK